MLDNVTRILHRDADEILSELLRYGYADGRPFETAQVAHWMAIPFPMARAALKLLHSSQMVAWYVEHGDRWKLTP